MSEFLIFVKNLFVLVHTDKIKFQSKIQNFHVASWSSNLKGSYEQTEPYWTLSSDGSKEYTIFKRNAHSQKQEKSLNTLISYLSHQKEFKIQNIYNL